MRTLAEYQISSKTGFVLEQPCCQLPPAWQAYDRLASAIVPILSQPDTDKASADLHLAVADLVVPSDHALMEMATAWSLETRCRLHLCLTCITASYLWHRGESRAPNRLPAQLARPLLRVAESLGLKPTIGHATLALANCALPDSAWSGRPEHLRLLCQPGPSSAFRAFVLVTCAFELDFARATPLLLRGAEARRPDEAADLLDRLADCLAGLTARFDDFGRLLDPDEFYRDVRPYLSGHEGLVFEVCR